MGRADALDADGLDVAEMLEQRGTAEAARSGRRRDGCA